MNPVTQAFVSSLRSRYAVDDGKSSLSEWIVANTTLRGKPFSFDKYGFQRKIADDTHPNLVCRKCSQVGLTETQVRKYLAFLSRTSGLTGIFTLPTDDMYGRVWDTRIKPILDGDRVFQAPDGENWTKRKGLFQLGHSNGIVTGCGEDDATSTPADLLMHDELDLSPQEIIALYQSRVQNSDYKIRQQFSTPTHVDYGVDGLYKLSDQHEFMIKCPACNHHQLPDFTPTFVRLPNARVDKDYFELSYEQAALLNTTDAHVACEQCNARLPLGNEALREWVPRYPERQNIRGYDVTPLSNDRITVPDIFRQLAEYKRLDNPRGFSNTVLGRAFAGDNARLRSEDIKACVVDDPPAIPRDAPVHLGIDLGQTCHLTAAVPTPSGPLVFLWETVKANDLKDRVVELKTQYPRLRGAGDRMPYTTEMDQIRDVTSSAVWPAQYAQPNAVRIRQVKDETGEVNHYQANRTMAIDAVANAVRKQRIGFANLAQHRATVIEHLQDMVRDEQPEKPAVWLKLTGNDHYFHALAFLLFSFRIAESDEYFNDVAPQTLMLLEGATGWTPPEMRKTIYNPFDRS